MHATMPDFWPHALHFFAFLVSNIALLYYDHGDIYYLQLTFDTVKIIY